MFKWLLISIIEWNILGISQIGKKFWMVTTIIRTGYRFSKMCSFLCVTFIKENTCFKYQSGKWYRNKIRFDFIFKNWWLHHNFLWSPQIHFHEQNYLDLTSFLKNTIVLYMNKTNSDYYHLWWLCLTISPSTEMESTHILGDHIVNNKEQTELCIIIWNAFISSLLRELLLE